MGVRHGLTSVRVSEAVEKWLWLSICSLIRVILSQKFARGSLVPRCIAI